MVVNAHIIEINDSEIRVAKDAKIILRSPGIAVVNNNDIHVGESASKMAYLNPRETYNRYWNKLNQDALHTPTKYYQHYADLAYAHLMTIYEQAGNPEELIFVVPGSYSSKQLSMLLGIAQACPFTAVGLIDSAVAGSAAVVTSAGEYQHIDMHLHQIVITRLDVGNRVSQIAVETIDEAGLHKIYTIMAGLVSDLFIQQSRFDPQRHAETEQALYDQLPACLKALRDEKVIMLEIQYRNTTHQAKLSRDILLQRLQPVYEKLTGKISRSIPCVIGDRLASLPGITDSISPVHVIKPEAVFESCQTNEAYIRSTGPELSFITSLPTEKNQIRTIIEPSPSSEEILRDKNVTHVLYRDEAYPINEQTIYLSANGNVSNHKPQDMLCSVSSQNGVTILMTDTNSPVLINGKVAGNSTELHPGDRVQTNNSEVYYSFIHVLTSHGTHKT